MGRYRRLWRLSLGRWRDVSREVDEEIRSHMRMRIDEYVAEGMSERDAARKAAQRFGDVDRTTAELKRAAHRRRRRGRRSERLRELWRDGVLSVRRARRAPGFTGFAVAVFALSIGLITIP